MKAYQQDSKYTMQAAGLLVEAQAVFRKTGTRLAVSRSCLSFPKIYT